MSPDELKSKIEEKLRKNLPSKVFLDRMRVLDEESRKTAAYNDPRYIPFYYFLGCFVEPKSLLEIGFRLGLLSGNFLKSCHTVEYFLAFQERTKDFYSPNLGRRNVRDNYKGEFKIYIGKAIDEEFLICLDKKWDLAIIDEEVGYDKYRSYLDVIWSKLYSGGFIIMDYVTRHSPAKESYFDFCKANNRSPTVVETRYGVGIVQK